MLTELSLHILDIAENSVRAKATLVEITVAVREHDAIEILIKDNGSGMDKETLERVVNPFYTSRTSRKVGLGIPFFRQAALQTEGSFEIQSNPGEGTLVKAVFGYDHLDRMPMGDLTETVHSLVVYHQDVDFRYRYSFNEKSFVMDTREFREILGDISFGEREVSLYIKEYLEENKRETDGGINY